MWQLAWSGNADDFDPSDITVNAWEEGPESARQALQAAALLMPIHAGHQVTLEANGNKEGYGGIFMSLTMQTEAPNRQAGMVKAPRTGHRQFTGATP